MKCFFFCQDRLIVNQIVLNMFIWASKSHTSSELKFLRLTVELLVIVASF